MFSKTATSFVTSFSNNNTGGAGSSTAAGGAGGGQSPQTTSEQLSVFAQMYYGKQQPTQVMEIVGKTTANQQNNNTSYR